MALAYYPTLGAEANACEALGPAISSPLIATPLENLIKTLDNAMEEASHLTLEPKCNPYPKGIDWWNNECDAAHTAG